MSTAGTGIWRRARRPFLPTCRLFTVLRASRFRQSNRVLLRLFASLLTSHTHTRHKANGDDRRSLGAGARPPLSRRLPPRIDVPAVSASRFSISISIRPGAAPISPLSASRSPPPSSSSNRRRRLLWTLCAEYVPARRSVVVCVSMCACLSSGALFCDGLGPQCPLLLLFHRLLLRLLPTDAAVSRVRCVRCLLRFPSSSPLVIITSILFLFFFFVQFSTFSRVGLIESLLSVNIFH